MATDDPAGIRSRDGEEFILEPADAFDQDVAELSQSERFMSFLAGRAQEPGGTTLEDVERRLAQTERPMTERP